MPRWWHSKPLKRSPTQPPAPSIGNGILPVEILEQVFSYTTFLDLVSCRLVCTLWASTTHRHFHPHAIHTPLPRPTNRSIRLFSNQIAPNKQHLPGMHVVVHDNGLRFSPGTIFRCKHVRLNPIISDPANAADLENIARHAAADWNAMYVSCPPVDAFDVLVQVEDGGTAGEEVGEG